MMYRQEIEFSSGDRVRIRNNVDAAVYNGLSTLGNEAIIKGVKTDRWGMPMVFVEWDKNHWSYNGAPDGWTFGEHFEKIANIGKTMKDDNDIDKIVGTFTDQLTSAIRKQISAAHEDVSPLDEVDTFLDESDRRRVSALESVIDRLEDAEAFVVIGVERSGVGEQGQQDHGSKLVPFALEFEETPEAKLVADAFLASVGAESFSHLVLQTIYGMYSTQTDGKVRITSPKVEDEQE